MAKYRKKPVVIEAARFTGVVPHLPYWAQPAITGSCSYGPDATQNYCTIRTLEGDMRCNYGDWIIQGIKGEVYPCKPDIFEATYEEVSP